MPGYAPSFAGASGGGVHAAAEPPLTNGATATGASRDGTNRELASILTSIGLLSLLVHCVTVLAWIYKSWEMLPPSLRVTGSGKHVSPAAAVGFLFVPLYNIYWTFVVSRGLCEALNRALEMYGSPKRASTGLANAAAVCQAVPYCNVMAPLLWLPFMFNVESAKREYVRVAGGANGPV